MGFEGQPDENVRFRALKPLLVPHSVTAPGFFMLSKIGVSGLCLGNVILSYIYTTELDFDCGVISLVNKFSLSFSVEKIYLLAWVTFFLLIKSDICFGVFIVGLVQLNINARYGDIVKIHPSIMEKLFFKKNKREIT